MRREFSRDRFVETDPAKDPTPNFAERLYLKDIGLCASATVIRDAMEAPVALADRDDD